MQQPTKNQSIWNTDVRVIADALFTRLSDDAPCRPAALGVALFVAAPALMAVLAMYHRQIDYTVFTHPNLIRHWIYPLAALAFAIAMFLAVGLAKRRGIMLLSMLRQHPVFVVFGFMAVWMLVSQCVNDLGYALFGYVTLTRGETFWMQLGYLLLLLAGAALVRRESYKTILIRLHLVVSLILVAAAFALWHTQVESAYFYDWRPAFTSIYTNTNYYGYYLSVAVPLAAAAFVAERKPFWKGTALVILGANTVALSINNTLGAWVACWASMVFLLVTHGILERHVNGQVLLVIAVFSICFYLPGQNLGHVEQNTAQLTNDVVKIATHAEDVGRAGSGRWGIWQGTIQLIQENPVFGIGFEGIANRDLKEITQNLRPHCEFLQYALFYGIPAGIAYFAGGFGVFLRALRKRAALDDATLVCLTGAFGYLVGSCFGLTLYCTAPFLFLFLGMGYVWEKKI